MLWAFSLTIWTLRSHMTLGSSWHLLNSWVFMWPSTTTRHHKMCPPHFTERGREKGGWGRDKCLVYLYCITMSIRPKPTQTRIRADFYSWKTPQFSPDLGSVNAISIICSALLPFLRGLSATWCWLSRQVTAVPSPSHCWEPCRPYLLLVVTDTILTKVCPAVILQHLKTTIGIQVCKHKT